MGADVTEFDRATALGPEDATAAPTTGPTTAANRWLPRPNLRPVRVRTALGAAGALAVVLALSLVAIGWLVGRQVWAASDAALLEQAGDRARLLADGADPATLVNVVGDEVVAVVTAADGTVLASTGTPEPEVVSSLPTGISDIEIEVYDDEPGGAEAPHPEGLRAAVVSGSDGSTVVVANEGEQAGATIAATWTILAVAGPLTALVGAAVAWLVAGWALAPVHRLRRDLEEVVALGGEARVTPPGTQDEIDGLARTMNDVLGRLERLAGVRRRFVADASHELKSPIANARALLESHGTVTGTDTNAETGTETDSGDRLRTGLLGELNRLQSLVEDLLFLARTDETSIVDATEFDLDDVVFDEAERATIRSEVRLDASGVQPARVVADRNEVARAVRNLLENGTHHARSTVRITVEERVGGWAVVVSDDGPGVPEPDRDRIFDRFARLDHDRSREQGGTGLGLSIVATIAERNGGSVELVDTGPDGGGRFDLTLPEPGG